MLHDVENDHRKRIVGARAVLVCAAEVDRVPPVIVDGAELPEEVTEILAELSLRRTPCRKIRLIIRPPADVDIVKRPHLEVVERFGEDEVHHRELHDVKHRFRRSDAQTLQ